MVIHSISWFSFKKIFVSENTYFMNCLLPSEGVVDILSISYLMGLLMILIQSNNRFNLVLHLFCIHCQGLVYFVTIILFEMEDLQLIMALKFSIL